MYWSSPKRRSSSRPFFEDAGRHVGVADGAEEDRVELAELVEAVGGQRFAGFEVAVAAPVEVLSLEREVFELGDGLEDLDAFGGDFGAGAVAADDGDFEGGAAHGRLPSVLRTG